MKAWLLYDKRGNYRFTVYYDADMSGVRVKQSLLDKGECRETDYLIDPDMLRPKRR